MEKQPSNKLNDGNLKNTSYKSEQRKSLIDEELMVGDFETAITAVGFGKFNVLLLLIAIPSAWSSEFDFTTMSYVVPAAQCDLNLSLRDKGVLNGITYLGTLTSAFLWGFLADTLGRRKILIYGYLTDGLFVILSAFFPNFYILLCFKFFNGFVIGGPYAVYMTFLSEFHSAKYRAPVLLLTGIYFSLANVAMSGLAWWLIPQSILISFFDGHIVIHSWQIFLMVSSLPSLICGFAYLYLPESPKFLMTSGRNTEALNVFQRVYAMNTGNPPEYFPIKRLLEENKKVVCEEKEEKLNVSGISRLLNGLRVGWAQIKPIFMPPYLMRILHIFLILFLGMLGENTMRLWLPQLFTKIDEYNQIYNYTKTASLCEMLDVTLSSSIVNSAGVVEDICTVTVVDDQVYINTIIVAMCNVLGFIIVTSFVNKIEKKWLLVIIYLICGLSGMGNYWSPSATITLLLVSIYGGFISVCTTMVISVIVDLFPTTLRTMSISLGMMTGRSGSMIGNVLFPILLEMGCLPPFILIGATAIACSFFCSLLPNLKLKSLD